MFSTVLIANRGEIARRIIRTTRRLGIRSVAVYSEADALLPYVEEADVAVPIGPPPPAQSYLAATRLIEVARQSGADAIHPGYGFLSEDAGFARAVIEAGLTWIGPAPDTIDAMGNKINARNLMAAAGVPVSPGSAEPITSAEAALRVAAGVGYPIMVKAAAGGGGIGMSSVRDDAELRAVLDAARDRAQRVFGSGDLLLERYVDAARHIEVQILGLADGQIVALGERDCSVQRRHQKVAEETPAPLLPDDVRADLIAAAVMAGKAVGYRGAGTVEFLYDPLRQQCSFLEMNTRLQVEHPVTELVTGIDLVEAQLRVAAGERPELDAVAPGGHALELRVYAEDPRRFLPSPGHITRWTEPSGPHLRVDAGYRDGTTVTPYYDPLLAKLCVWGRSRAEAVARARAALAGFAVEGPKTNLGFLRELVEHPVFVAGEHTTNLVATMRPEAA